MNKLLRRLTYLVRRGRREAELREEMDFHRDMLAHRSLGGGGFGNATLAREDARAVWIAPWIESVMQDVVYAVRTLRREPAFAVLAIGALTAGIGLNSSLFTVYSALAMKPWAVRDPGRVGRIYNTSPFDLRTRAGGGPSGFSRAELDYIGQHAKTVTGLVTIDRSVTVRSGDAEVTASWVGGGYFTVLGVDMAAGRGFLPDEDRPGAPSAVAVLSHGFWVRQFGGDPSIVGREIRLDDVPFTVVGVAGREFLGTLPDRVDVWLPVASAATLRPADAWVRNVALKPENCCTSAAARVANGITWAQAQAELNLLSRQFRAARAGDAGRIELRGTQVFADPRQDGSAVFVPLLVGLILVLLLACANVGNLLLARSAARRREIAVRLSLGASRRRIVRQLLTESFMLAFVAGAAGVIVAAWLPGQVVRLAAGGTTALRLQPDAMVLIFTLAVVTLSTVIFGLAPALQSTRRDAMHAIKEGSALPGARFSLRTLLLSVQVAVVVVLLVSAGIMVRSARRAADRALGAPARGLFAVSITPPALGYDETRTRAIAIQLEQELEQAASAGAIALTSTPPFVSGNIKGGFRLPGDAGNEFNNQVYEVSPGYFALIGLSIVDGRDFERSDAGRPMIVVNETMARQVWPGQRAVGQRIVCTPPYNGWNMPGELEIIGVVKDSYTIDLQDIQPTIFQPITHRGLPSAIVSNRASAEAATGIAARIDSRLTVRVQALNDTLNGRLRRARIGSTVAGALGLLALGFASVGMFGVFAYWVRQRTQEIGVRMALGAQSSDVIGLLLGTTLRAVLAGLGAGLIASIAGAKLLRSFLFGLSGIDPLTYAAVVVILVVASALAAFLPARRATRIDPLVALRYE